MSPNDYFLILMIGCIIFLTNKTNESIYLQIENINNKSITIRKASI